MSKKETKEEVNYLKVISTHCLKCHHDYRDVAHPLTCDQEVTQCGKVEGKECEFKEKDL